MNHTHLFLFTIGPVQSFIAQARKAHDLFAGSRLLSHLCRAGIDKAIELWGPDCIIMPLTSADSIPNRFYAKVTMEVSEKELAQHGNAIKGAVGQALITETNKAIFGLSTPVGFDDQILRHLDIQWLFVKNDGNYNSTFRKLNEHLSAIKNVRTFSQWPETGRKCIVDGERNVKVYRKVPNESTRFLTHKLWQTASDVAVLDFGDETTLNLKSIQPGEGLSAVSFVKRMFRSDKNFPSTAEIALLDLLESKSGGVKLKDTSECGRFQNIFTTHFDYQLFFDDNLTEKYFDKHGLFPKSTKAQREAKVTEAQVALGVLKEKVKTDYEEKPFSKYYALIQFDGDHVGKWLKGDGAFLLPGSSGDLNLEKFHHAFTRAVSSFADAVEAQLKLPYGKTVFAGGEDFLGLVNLHHLFPVMRWLQGLYREKVDKVLRLPSPHYSIVPGMELTLSAGVVIPHYKEPLSEVLQTLKAAEQQAKDSGRNRFVIQAVKHAGGDLVCGLPWHINQKSVASILYRLTQLLFDRDFSNNFIQDTCRTLEVMQMQPPSNLVLKDLKRTVPRSCNLVRKDEEKKEAFRDRKEKAIDGLYNSLKLLHDSCLRKALKVKIQFDKATDKGEIEKYEQLLKIELTKGYNDFAQVLSLCDFITRKTR